MGIFLSHVIYEVIKDIISTTVPNVWQSYKTNLFYDLLKMVGFAEKQDTNAGTDLNVHYLIK